MTVTQAVVEAAEDGFRYVFGDDPKTPRVHAIKALIDAAREQLGQQAAAPGVEREALAAVQLARLNGLFDAAIGNQINDEVDLILNKVDAALAVAPPPVGLGQRSNAEIAADLNEVGMAKHDGFHSWQYPLEIRDLVREAAAALSPPPVRGGK